MTHHAMPKMRIQVCDAHNSARRHALRELRPQVEEEQMIWSDVAGDIEAGMREENGCVVYNKIGCYVLTLEELRESKR